MFGCVLLNLRLPFDAKNPFVYLIVVTYQLIGVVYILLLLACTVSIGIGLCLFLLSETGGIKRILLSFNDRAKAHKIEPHTAMKQLTDAIQLQTNSKEFVIFALVFLEFCYRITKYY